MRSLLITTVLLESVARAGQQDATTMKQASDRSLQLLGDWLGWVFSAIQTVWIWSADQISHLTQTPWDHWPLSKQILLLMVTTLVIYILFLAARQLWSAAINLLSAVAGFIGTLIVTLPTILLAGAIALTGLWIINNLNDLASLHFPGDTGTSHPNHHDDNQPEGG